MHQYISKTQFLRCPKYFWLEKIIFQDGREIICHGFNLFMVHDLLSTIRQAAHAHKTLIISPNSYL